MKQQTAVEWFFENLNSHKIPMTANELFEQAKEMEKSQIMQAYNHGWDDRQFNIKESFFKNADEDYYNKIYNNEND
jgi:hypothetical protein